MPELISANRLEKLTGVKRQTIAKRCEGLTTTPGPRRAKLYDSEQALQAIYLGGGMSAAREKARLDHHRANLAEIDEQTKRGQLVPIDEVMRVVGQIIAVVRNRLMALPIRLAGELPVKVAVRKQAEQHLTDSVHALLHEMADELQGTVAEQLPAEPAGKGKGKGKK